MEARTGSFRDRYIVLSLLLLAHAAVALGHQDRRITLTSDGRLQGLPPEFEPAYLHLPPRGSAERARLELHGKRLEFPDCLSVLFAKASLPHMRLSASWYHDRTILPYYLSIDLPTKAPNAHGYYDGWSVLVDISEVRVLRVRAVFATSSTSQREQEIDIKSFCGSGGVTETIGRVK